MRFVLPWLALACLMPAATAAPPSAQSPIVANPTEVAVYVPPSMLTARAYLPVANLWVEPGKALSEAVSGVGTQYFPNLRLVPGSEDRGYGLLLDLAPEWSPVPGKVKLSIRYDVYGLDGAKLHGGKVEQQVAVKSGNFNAAAYAAARVAVQQVMADVVRQVKPDPVRFPASGQTAKIDPRPLVDRDKPHRTGTGFFINTAGQLLTAAHVSRDCTLLEAHQDGVTFPVTARASSALLDLAVLDSGRPRAAALPLREGHAIVLGEAITSVGYPLQGLLGDSPNVTRGNISSSKGIRGALGMLQFSAPIQPGNSGGPLVSDTGELLGVTVGTLSAEALVKRGLIPQNVNFALDARHVSRFLQREGVAFATARPHGEGGLQVANAAALSNTVQITCYQ